jgi:hypothetical protein
MSAPAPSVDRGTAPSALAVSRGPLLPGAYAWLSTVLLPVWFASGGPLVQALAWGSALALVLGELATLSRVRWLRGVGAGTFVAGCLATWILLAEQLRAAPIDATQAAVGGIGWVLFALSVQSSALETEPDARRLFPVESNRRRRFPPLLDFAFLALVVAGLLPLLIAWRVERTVHAALAQVIACGAALCGLSLAGSVVDSVALRRGLGRGSARLAASWSTFAILVLLLVVGLVFKLF